MSNTALTPSPISRAALEVAPQLRYFILIGVLLLAGAFVAPVPLLSMSLGLLGLTFSALALIVAFTSLRHRQAEARLYDTIAEFVAFDAAPSFTTDTDGVVSYANAAAVERFGQTEGDTLVATMGDLFASPATVLYRLQNRALASGSAREDVVLRNGHMRLTVHRVGAGGFLWRLEDIGERSEAGRSGEAIGLPMMTVSRAGTILFMNEALRRMLGGRETTLDRVFTDLPLRPGEVHHVVGAHGPVAVLAVEVELSANRQEIYLLPEPARYAVQPGEWGVVETLPVPLLKLDRDGRILSANRRARQLLGNDNAVGGFLSDQVEGLGRPVFDWLRDAWEGRGLGRTETMRAPLRDQGEEVFVQVTLEQVREGDELILVAVLADATELRNLEAQFVQSQKMQAIGQLAGGVAHDFNNLLTAISGHCDLLLLRHDAGDPEYGDLSQISQNANRAAGLVGQLLAFSRKQTLRPEVLDLGDAMGDLSHLLGRLVGERIQLEFRSEGEILPVRADKRQLEQVLMNLVVNARDAMMPEGGRIQLVLANHFLDRPLGRDRASVPAGDWVTIKVIDEGTGIKPAVIAKIFEPFVTTKGPGKGTGLGLSMVYGIVKQSGGFIFVDSVEGAGATFTIYLPAHREHHQPEAEPSAPVETPDEAALSTRPDAALPHPNDIAPPVPPPAPAVEGTILLVEDEAPVRAFASRALRLRGHQVVEAESGEDALEILRDLTLDVDVFVTDVIMPGKDGPTWVAEALETRPGVKVVFVSGYAEDSVSAHQARIPNSVFLPKPFSLSELTETVARQLA